MRALAFFAVVVVVSCGESQRDFGGASAGGSSGSANTPNSAAGSTSSSVGGGSSGGSENAGGANSAAGTTSGRACEKDEDCDDHLACSGEEKCVEGVCVNGTAPCAAQNPDPVHCEVLCTEAEGKATCGKTAGRDGDTDGYRDKACAADVEATDCNDAEKPINPGAPEICDGIDNNCNGKADLNDGLTVGGETKTLAENGADAGIAWSPEEKVFGIVYRELASSEIVLRILDAAGQVKAPPIVGGIGAITDMSDELSRPSVVWGGDAFGVAWLTKFSGLGGSPLKVSFTRVNAQGAMTPPTLTFSTEATSADKPPQIARFGKDDWILAWETGASPNRKVFVRTYSFQNSTAYKLDIGADRDAHDVRLAVSGNELAVAWVAGADGSETAWLTRLSTELKILNERKIGKEPPDNFSKRIGISADAGGYATTWQEKHSSISNPDGQTIFALKDRNGQTRCGPEPALQKDPSEFGGAEHLATRAARILEYPGGYAAFTSTWPYVGKAPGFLTVHRFGTDCKAISPLVKVTFEGAPAFDMAYGSNTFVAVWDYMALKQIRYRMFAKEFCR